LNFPVLTIASGNQRKVSEISEMLDVLSLKVEKQPEYLNVEETGKTYYENALLKAKAASLETKTWALADDSGLEVDILDGRPGIYSARYAKNNAEKIKKLSLAFFIYFIAFTGLTNILIFFLQESLNWTTKASSGTLVLVGIIAIIVQGGLIGPLVKQFGEMRLTLNGSGFILVACTLLITAPKENATINI